VWFGDRTWPRWDEFGTTCGRVAHVNIHVESQRTQISHRLVCDREMATLTILHMETKR
jgi:hypothetical protein